MAVTPARAELAEQLKALNLPEEWLSVHAFAPNIYMALQPGVEVGKRDESYLTVQSHAIDGKIGHIRKSLENGSVKPGSKFGEWRVEMLSRSGDECFELKLQSARPVEQEWCFVSGKALVVTESGPRRLDEKTRKRVHAILLKEGS